MPLTETKHGTIVFLLKFNYHSISRYSCYSFRSWDNCMGRIFCTVTSL